MTAALVTLFIGFFSCSGEQEKKEKSVDISEFYENLPPDQAKPDSLKPLEDSSVPRFNKVPDYAAEHLDSQDYLIDSECSLGLYGSRMDSVVLELQLSRSRDTVIKHVFTDAFDKLEYGDSSVVKTVLFRLGSRNLITGKACLWQGKAICQSCWRNTDTELNSNDFNSEVFVSGPQAEGCAFSFIIEAPLCDKIRVKSTGCREAIVCGTNKTLTRMPAEFTKTKR